MKTFRFFLLLGFLASCFTLSGCATAPTERVQEVKTLKAVGLAVDGTMRLAAQLYHDGKISAVVWSQVADVHDHHFQPAFNLAVKAVQSDLSTTASPDLLRLADQLRAILTPYLTR